MKTRPIRDSTLSFCGMIVAAAAMFVTVSWRCAAQEASEEATLALAPATLPKASPKHPYRYQFVVEGGTAPARFTIVKGVLPAGMKLSPEGELSGSPAILGDYRFSVGVRDSSRPPQRVSREFVLHVVTPLLLKWSKQVQITGHRADGLVTVSNSTEDDFDFTFIVLAVNEYGRAFAIGYQHFPLKSGADEFEIPFGDTLPHGSYVVHVDGVAEVPVKDRIYRARLQSKQLEVTAGP